MSAYGVQDSWPCLPLVIPVTGLLVDAPRHVRETPRGVIDVQDATAAADIPLENPVCPMASKWYMSEWVMHNC